MAKETVFSPRGALHRNLVGCIIVHPHLGHGLVTSTDRYWTEVHQHRRQVWTVLWSETGTTEDVDERIMQHCMIVDGPDGGKEWGSWAEVVGHK